MCLSLVRTLVEGTTRGRFDDEMPGIPGLLSTVMGGSGPSTFDRTPCVLPGKFAMRAKGKSGLCGGRRFQDSGDMKHF